MIGKLKKIQLGSSKGFTLLELMIVVGILAILATIAFLAINPAAVNERTRDSKRLKDMATLQGIVEQYINDYPEDVPVTGITSQSTGASASGDCDGTGWLGGSMDVCEYINTIPVDPVNRTGRQVGNDGVKTSGNLWYEVAIDTDLEYNICTNLEAVGSAARLLEDGNTDNNRFEVFSSTAAVCDP